MSRLLSKLLSGLRTPRRRGRAPGHSRQAARPTVEVLEARNLLSGFVPSQMRHAYGMDRVAFGDASHSLIYGNGAGQTIGIVDAYDDPNIASDLAYFDSYFGLAAPPSFSKVNQTGGTTYPAANAGWAQEIAIDVEWAHVMAPAANILLVEANTNGGDLYTAASYAGSHANEVSMSWGAGEWSGETGFDSYFTHTGTTYFASTGDNGQPGGYPAYSPNVVAVGGTSLYLDGSGNYSSESGWGGSGGGISQYESQPAYQNGVVTQSTTRRTIPDLSMVADPNTGAWTYNTYQSGGWGIWGGTSLASPLLAGVTAVVNQGNAYEFNGYPSYSGYNYLNSVYHLPQTDLNDVTTGYNGYYAGPGYDLVTGRGTPVADRFASALDGAPVYNPLTGELLVTGGAHNSTDTITLSQNASGQLVVQISASLTLPGSGIPASQTFYYNSGQYSSVTVCTSDGSGSTTVNIQNTTGVTVNLEDHNSTTVNVGTSTSPAHNTVNIWETSGAGTTINGSSTMTVNVGKNGSVQNIQGYVLLDNPPNFTTVNVDDSADSGNRTAYVGVTTFSSATWEYVSGLAPAAIYAKWGDTSSMTVHTGTGTETVNVYSTRFATTLYGHSLNTTVNVGSGNSVQDITGNLTIINPPSYTAVNLYDSADAAIRSVTINSSGVFGLAPAGIYLSAGSVRDLYVYGGSANNTYTVAGTPSHTWVEVYTGGGSDTVNVLATSVPLYVYNSGGQDSVYVGSGGAALNGTMANIFGFVDVYGAGSTYLYLGDSGDTASHTVNMNNGSLTGLAPATIYWTPSSTATGGVTYLDVRGGSGNNTYNVNNTSAFYYYTYLNTGGGTDTTNILATTGTLYVYTTTSPYGSGNDQVKIGNAGNAQGINGTVYIYNYPSSDHVTIDDSADSANRSVTVGSGSVTGLTPAAINVVTSGSVSTLTILGGSGTDSYTVTGTPAITSVTLTAGSGTNTLIGPNVNSTWQLTGTNAGTLQSSGLAPVNFTGVANLTGGSAADAFVFADAAGVTGNINGGGGTNLLDYLAYTTAVTVDLSAGTATGVGGTVANIQQLRGGQSDDTLNGNAAGGTTFFASPGNDTITGQGSGNTLVGTNAASTWSVTAQNAGTLTWATSTTTFTGIQNLTGGSAADAFVLSDGVGVDGSINGGGGVNTLDESAYTTNETVNLGTNTATGTGGIANLQSFIGGAATNTLIGPNAVTTWNVTAQNVGTLTGGISFNAFQNLTGGTGADTFVLANGVGVDGNIDGGGGVNTLNDAAYTTAVTVDLTANTATGVTGTIANLQGFVGGSNAGNALNGPAANTTWTLSGSNAGSLTGGFSFSAFGNLTGGAGNNTFVFASGASLSGTLNGGGGTNALDFSAYSTSVIVDLQTGQATGIGGGLVGAAGAVTNIINVHGANSSGAGLYNLLIGSGGNVLTGGTNRRNLLVAGGTASTLIGGNGEDLLIGGTTNYDTETGLTSWQAIAAYWAGTDSYSTRASNLQSGTGVPLLDATTVTGNGGGNTMTGSGALALLYTDGSDTITGFNAGSQTVTISP